VAHAKSVAAQNNTTAALKVDEQRPSCDLCDEIIALDIYQNGTGEGKRADSEAAAPN
jgi:hypothetical protein